MAAKNVILKRKIGTDIYELLPKTTEENVQVTYGLSMTLASALSSIYTDVQAWNTFKADVDFAGNDSALDTLRELIDMIAKEEQAGSIAASLIEIRESITTLQTSHAADVQTINETISSLDTRVGALETTVGEHTTQIAALDTRITETEAGSSHIYTSSTQPQTLTEQDLWIEVVDGTDA